VVRTLRDTGDVTETDVTAPCVSMHSLAVIWPGAFSQRGNWIGGTAPLTRRVRAGDTAIGPRACGAGSTVCAAADFASDGAGKAGRSARKPG
jgi:hypothetical protein